MYVNPCNSEDNVINLGSECDDSLLAPAMEIFAPIGTKVRQTDIDSAGSLTEYINARLHDVPAKRWYAIFGSHQPIKSVTSANESDVLFTFQSGATKLVRRGMIIRSFMTDKGGLCLAQKLFKFNFSKYGLIEVDVMGKIQWMKGTDATSVYYAPFPINEVYGLTPTPANFTDPYQNGLYVNLDSNYYIGRGVILAPTDDEDVLNLQSLIDAQLTAGVTPSTTTNIYFKASTICGETDLVALYPGTGAGALAQITNFIVKNAGGTVITPSAAVVDTDQIKLTGAYPTGTNITVQFNIPSVLLANGIDGYEGTVILTIAIP